MKKILPQELRDKLYLLMFTFRNQCRFNNFICLAVVCSLYNLHLDTKNVLLYSPGICLAILNENKRLLSKRTFSTQVLPFIDACYKTKLTRWRISVICHVIQFALQAVLWQFFFGYIKRELLSIITPSYDRKSYNFKTHWNIYESISVTLKYRMYLV